MKKPVITAFKNSPDKGRGLARDLRVRWAFEEVGQAYDVRLVTFDEMKQPEYRTLQPFRQIPAYQDDDLVLFETGAIVLHIAETHEGLLPSEPKARARAISWMFSALNTVEPVIVEREAFFLWEREKPYYEERIPMLDKRVLARLEQLSTRLAQNEWLDGAFSAADILMVTVLRRLEKTTLLDGFANLRPYVARGEARAAYKRAFDAQYAVFTAST